VVARRWLGRDGSWVAEEQCETEVRDPLLRGACVEVVGGVASILVRLRMSSAAERMWQIRASFLGIQ